MEVKSWFHLLLYAAVGFAATLVIMIVAAQVWYITPGEFAGALGQPDIRHAIGLSILTATAAESLGLVLAVPTAYVLSRSTFPGRAVLDAVLDIPIILSPLALGTALLLFFRTAPGLWIEQTLVHFVFEIPGIILAQFFLAFALSVRVMKAGFESIDIRCEQVARFLGCSAFQAFLHVSLPMVRRSLVAAFILGWARALGDFGASVTLAGAVKGKTETIPVSIYLNLADVHIEKAVALMLIMTGIALVVLLAVRVCGGTRRGDRL